MNQPSNISEAAWDTAERVLTEALNYDTTLASVQEQELADVAAIIQSALDSTHPAPKEGETPETDRIFNTLCEWLGEYDKKRVYFSDVANACYSAKCDLRSLELRLAEKTREAEALRIEYESRAVWIAKMNAILGYDNHDGFHSEPDPHTIAASLRTRLQQAEELLREAHGWLPNENVAKLCQVNSASALIARIATFLNSKTP